MEGQVERCQLKGAFDEDIDIVHRACGEGHHTLHKMQVTLINMGSNFRTDKYRSSMLELLLAKTTVSPKIYQTIILYIKKENKITNVFDVKEDIPSDSSIIKPSDGYDSVSGETGNSIVYMMYENGRAYPEYLVTYTTA